MATKCVNVKKSRRESSYCRRMKRISKTKKHESKKKNFAVKAFEDTLLAVPRILGAEKKK